MQKRAQLLLLGLWSKSVRRFLIEHTKEAGKVFAAVAQEVRELAQCSASAAKDSKGLIARSAEAVRQGFVLVDKAGHSLQSIVDPGRAA